MLLKFFKTILFLFIIAILHPTGDADTDLMEEALQK
jgi:hypothetical protein